MNSHLKWSSHLLRSLFEQGVRHIVLSPGSRSTPLAMAAAIHPGFEKHVVIDERSAGFMALGIGKATGKPAALICTSGTAGANYMPAVIEARQSGVPMIVLTADRPPNQRGIGSSQTIDQIKLYGDQAVFFHEAGEPAAADDDLRRLAWLARQAVEESVRSGGAAHINMPFRKPLEPGKSEIEQETNLNRKHYEEHLGPDKDSGSHTVHLPKAALNLLQNAERPLIIAGPANPHHALRSTFRMISSKLGAPVIAEPGASLLADESVSVNRYEQILRNRENLERLRPDLIIRFGDQPFTKSLLLAFSAWSKDEIPVLHFTARRQPQDQSMSTTFRIFSDPGDDIDLPDDLASGSDKGTGWLNSWKVSGEAAENMLYNVLDSEKKLSDGHVMHYLSISLDPEWNVMLSNSFIPRDMALFGRPGLHRFVNRGTAGIDGIISTAAGIHHATDRPTVCITGDIAFLHDSNALLSLRDLNRPFVIIILNNGGGNIFRMLPVYEHSEYYTRYFETPQNVQLKSLAEAHGLDYLFADTPEALHSLNLQNVKGTLIAECKTDPDVSMEMRHRLWNFGSHSDK